MAVTALFTRRDYEALPEDFRAQLMDGCLVREPPPSLDHQGAQSRILGDLMRRLGPDVVYAAPVAVVVDELNVFEPDIIVLSEPRTPGATRVDVPLAVFEILSPSTRKHDRRHKVPRLLGLGVREVWLVDPVARLVEVRDVDGRRGARGPEAARSRVIGTSVIGTSADAFELVPDVLFAPA